LGKKKKKDEGGVFGATMEGVYLRKPLLDDPSFK
jgi:hypothetical protein